MTATPAMVLAFGLLLGMQHATEADHLPPVASLASRERSLRAGVFPRHCLGHGPCARCCCSSPGALGVLGWAISPLVAGNLERRSVRC
jgi:hypothetical protein